MAATPDQNPPRSPSGLRPGERQVRRENRERPRPGQYLTFRIASETYGVPVLETSEVLAWEESTPVPGAATWIHGLLNVRGRAVPVIDLATKFGVDGRRAAASTCIIVLEVVLDEEPAQVGLVADDMPAVVPLEAGQISDPPLFGTLVHARYLRGMARLDSGLVLLLDAVGALSAEDVALLKQLEETSAAAEADPPDAEEPPPATEPSEPAPEESRSARSSSARSRSAKSSSAKPRAAKSPPPASSRDRDDDDQPEG